MDIKVAHLPGGVAVVTPSDKLNMASAMELREAISALVTAGMFFLVIDLSEVDFIDSSGLGGLVSGLKTARQHGGDLRLAAPNDQVKLVLELTNLDKVLVAYADSESALQAWPR
ncbi:STAS domain-containing protein [Amnibacterium flavum]|uniref:Anti-sigma factor antagonist n=1 Tax=Amnibacterium flavum TaxID=2173173 RepID=A0A2V1HXQ9_9MICO|nr:STAS domain-containing protein [Amnibacterium flavum]PVZ96120.1 anti-anti-sigma factor [Amnibacterium flavum]